MPRGRRVNKRMQLALLGDIAAGEAAEKVDFVQEGYNEKADPEEEEEDASGSACGGRWGMAVAMLEDE